MLQEASGASRQAEEMLCDTCGDGNTFYQDRQAVRSQALLEDEESQLFAELVARVATLWVWDDGLAPVLRPISINGRFRCTVSDFWGSHQEGTC